MRKHNETWQNIADKWRAGENVWSAELGGIGPAYEQCIQEILFEILCRWPKNESLEAEQGGKSYPQKFSDLVDQVASELQEKFGGFSGAQVGAAKGTAFQFIHHGYSEMMNKLEDDRHILVSKAKFI